MNQNDLKERLDYNPETGIFTWLHSDKVPKKYRGAIAGRQERKGKYISIGIDYKDYQAHRLAWLYMTGEWPTKDVDHKNRIKHDNRWENLRLATDLENGANRSVSKTKVSSIYKGVFYVKSRRRWMASIQYDGVKKNLGYYFTENEAAEVYNNKAKELFGEFASLNEIDYSRGNTKADIRAKPNSSGYFGVAKHGSGWQAKICHDYKNIYIGFFQDPIAAAKAYNEKAIELKGSKARLNDI